MARLGRGGNCETAHLTGLRSICKYPGIHCRYLSSGLANTLSALSLSLSLSLCLSLWWWLSSFRVPSFGSIMSFYMFSVTKRVWPCSYNNDANSLSECSPLPNHQPDGATVQHHVHW